MTNLEWAAALLISPWILLNNKLRERTLHPNPERVKKSASPKRLYVIAYYRRPVKVTLGRPFFVPAA